MQNKKIFERQTGNPTHGLSWNLMHTHINLCSSLQSKLIQTFESKITNTTTILCGLIITNSFRCIVSKLHKMLFVLLNMLYYALKLPLLNKVEYLIKINVYSITVHQCVLKCMLRNHIFSKGSC